MTTLQFNMHPAQLEIYSSPARFKVVAAGRRFGKSYLAAMLMILYALRDTHTGVSGAVYNELLLKPVYYVGPTFRQAKTIMWDLLKYLGAGVIAHTHENDATVTLVNGRKILIRGADDPNSLRGSGYHFVVMDEYAFMKEEVWEKIIRPALGDVEGDALFIGTPEGENHFYQLFLQAQRDGLPTYQSWQFTTLDNPTIARSEVEQARNSLSSASFAQEYEASFFTAVGDIFDAKWFIKSNVRPEGSYYIAVDLAGFTNIGTATKKELKIKDESAIAVCVVNQEGWWVDEIIHGHWDVRETALRIMKAYKDYRPVALGIEKGVLKQAVMPYLEDEMKRLGVYFTPYELTHGNQNKPERIKWALQGRAEKGRIKLNDGEWASPFLKQVAAFPSPLAHDDLIDALAYIDQLASVVYFDQSQVPEMETLDDLIGF